MDQKQFKAMVVGTVLVDAMAVNLADVVAPNNKVENEYAVLGVMSDLEKRFFFLAYQKREAVIEKEKEILIICENCEKDEDSDGCPLVTGQIKKQLKELENQTKQISALMWSLIQLRLGSRNMAIREGFKIEFTKDGRRAIDDRPVIKTILRDLNDEDGFHDPIMDFLHILSGSGRF